MPEPRDVKQWQERREIARQCEEAAAEVAAKYPIAARILMSEAERWRRT